jgi:hypothetical protein
MAMVNAGEMTFRMDENVIVGSVGIGSVRGIPPKRLPMVSTGHPMKATAAAAISMPTREPGITCVTLGTMRIPANAINAVPMA